MPSFLPLQHVRGVHTYAQAPIACSVTVVWHGAIQ